MIIYTSAFLSAPKRLTFVLSAFLSAIEQLKQSIFALSDFISTREQMILVLSALSTLERSIFDLYAIHYIFLHFFLQSNDSNDGDMYFLNLFLQLND